MSAHGTTGGWRVWLPGLALALGCVLSSGCGGADDGGDVDSCTLDVGVAEGSILESPGAIRLYPLITYMNGYGGLEAFEWQVWLDEGQLLEIQQLAQDGWIEVDTNQGAGVYRARITGRIGDTQCDPGELSFNVAWADAARETYVLRAVPPDAYGLVAQSRTLEIAGGANALVDTWPMEEGVTVTGTVRTSAGDAVAAYLRFSGDRGHRAETFSDPADGRFSTRLSATQNYELSIVPGDDPANQGLAPVRMDVSAGVLDLVLEPGQIIVGEVRAASGDPVVGARVLGYADGVPTSVATSAADGSFELWAHALGVPLSLHVTPPRGAGLPALELPVDAGLLATSDPVLIAYHAGLSQRALFGLAVHLSDGQTVAPNARVTLSAASMPGGLGATVSMGSQSAEVAGTARLGLLADELGALPGVTLPEAYYDVVVEPAVPGPGEYASLTVLDLTPGSPDPTGFSLAPPARVLGAAHDPADPDGPPLADMIVRARALDALATAATAATRTEAADGNFALDLVAGGTYELVLESQASAVAETRILVSAPPPAQSLDLGRIELTPALGLSGRVSIASRPGAASGVHIQLLCATCDNPERPLAQAITSETGAFELRAPDPGRF